VEFVTVPAIAISTGFRGTAGLNVSTVWCAGARSPKVREVPGSTVAPTGWVTMRGVQI
jgi:hypothetical protein